MPKPARGLEAVTLGVILAAGCGPHGVHDGGEEEEADLSGSVAVRAVHSGKCAEVAGASTTRGAAILQEPCNQQKSQVWTLKNLGSNTYNLVSQNSGLCLDVTGGSMADGGAIEQWTCNGGDNQKWHITTQGSGFRLQAVRSGKCLDVTGGSTSNGALFEQWSCHDSANQTFALNANGGGTTPPPSSGGNFPARFAAPYVETWNDNNLGSLASSTGHKFYTLAFVLNGQGTCNPTWNGDTNLTGNNYGKYITSLRAAGGDVIVSFGGADGDELGTKCGSVGSLQAAYQKVIDQFHLTWIDLDIESGAESDTTSVDRRNKALHNLQAANPDLKVTYTLTVERNGLPGADVNLLKNAKSNGVRVDVVNIMAMDYGPCFSDMGQAAIDAANATRSQLSSIGLGASVGVTPMAGVNDVTCENFTTANAQQLASFAQSNGFVRTLGYWALGSDPSHAYLKIFHSLH
jgi:chitinase